MTRLALRISALLLAAVPVVAFAQGARVPRPLPPRREPVASQTAPDTASTAAGGGWDLKGNVKLIAPRPADAPAPLPTQTAVPQASPAPRPVPPTALTTPDAAAAAGLRGRYRVTLTGMVVAHQTWDNPLQLDGKGDEIFVAVPLMLYDGQTRQIQQDLKRTAVLGDVNGHPAFVQAGRASERGGLQSGNRVPDVPTPWTRYGEATTNRLPLLLWEGELVQGRHALVVSPAPWEWDDVGDFFDRWRGDREQRLRDWASSAEAGSLLAHAFVKPVDLPTSTMITLDVGFGQARDRPIGLRKATAADVAPPPATAASASINGQMTPNGFNGLAGIASNLSSSAMKMQSQMDGRLLFHEQLVVLTPFTIEQALTNPGKAGARLPGIIELRFTDDARLQGNYTLYLQVERLP